MEFLVCSNWPLDSGCIINLTSMQIYIPRGESIRVTIHLRLRAEYHTPGRVIHGSIKKGKEIEYTARTSWTQPDSKAISLIQHDTCTCLTTWGFVWETLDQLNIRKSCMWVCDKSVVFYRCSERWLFCALAMIRTRWIYAGFVGLLHLSQTIMADSDDLKFTKRAEDNIAVAVHVALHSRSIEGILLIGFSS